LHTRVELSGNTFNELQLASLSATNADATVEFSGGNFKFQSEPSGRIHGGGSTGQLTVNNHDKGKDITIAASTLTTDMQHLADGVYSGSVSWGLPSATFADTHTGSTVSLGEISVSSTTSMTDNLLEGDSIISIGEIEAPIPVTAAGLDFTMYGIPLDGMVRVQNLTDELAASDALNDQETEQMAKKMIDAYKSLIVPGSGITYAVSMSNQGGDIGANIGLDFVGDGSDSGTDNMHTVRDLMNAITATAKLDADTLAVDLTPAGMFMGHPMAAQYIIDDGVKYTSDLKVEDLLLYANGETMDIVGMFGLEPMLDQSLDILGSL